MELYAVTLYANSGINAKVFRLGLTIVLTTKVKSWAVWANSSKQATNLGLLECERIWSSADGFFNHQVSIQVIPLAMRLNQNANIIATTE